MEAKIVRFTPYFEWCEIQDDEICRIGITDLAQKMLGEIVYLELPAVGEQVEKDRSCAFIESKKSIVDILAPISGVVIEANQLLITQPNTINKFPYKEGWLMAIRMENKQDWHDLLEQEPIQ